jgi:hypothetical protein
MSEIKKTYTLADLEEAKQVRDSDRHSNPGRTRRSIGEAWEREAFVRERLVEQGDLPKPPIKEPDPVQAELDRLHPNAKSKQVVELDGERYVRRYVPLDRSRSGKTVKAWHGYWERG